FHKPFVGFLLALDSKAHEKRAIQNALGRIGPFGILEEGLDSLQGFPPFLLLFPVFDPSFEGLVAVLITNVGNPVDKLNELGRLELSNVWWPTLACEVVRISAPLKVAASGDPAEEALLLGKGVCRSGYPASLQGGMNAHLPP